MDKKPETEVKKEDGDASTIQQEVKKEDAGASAAQEGGVDLADALEKALTKLDKAETDRDNYKKGLLKAKGKDELVEIEDDEFTDKVKVAVQAALAESDELKAAKEARELTEKLIRRNKELETAVSNKSQNNATGMGSNSDTSMKVGDNMLSEDQLQNLKARGWDDKKIALFKKNLTKVT